MTEMRLLTTTLTILLLASSQLQAGKIKCWTNNEGIRECGNVVPPEYAQKGHEVLNRQGVTVDKVERAKTPEELAEAKRLAAIKAEEDRLRKEQENRDRVLLHTFSSEDEIIMARDGKITALKTEIRLTKKSMAKTQERLDALLKQAANLERAGKPVPEKLAGDIKTATEQVDEYRAFISTRQSEQDRIKAQFDNDMTRYKLLKSGKVRRPPLKTPETAKAR
ncbi:MAG: hypothetical protein PVF52_04975 [Granulosicoccaceae bacterium]|jgi:hypothetical protein